MNRGLGYTVPKPDSRDYSASRLIDGYGEAEPRGYADNSWQTVEVLDQYSLGSCVLNGIMEQIRALTMKERGLPDSPKGLPSLGSRLSSYYFTRVVEGEENQDNGCDPRTAMKSICKRGILPEADWPYDIAKFAQCPPDLVLRNSYDQRAFEYSWIQTLGRTKIDDVKLLLDAGYQIGIGGQIGDEYGEWKPGEAPLTIPVNPYGGHYRVLEGYVGDVFRELGSWGTGLGDNGRVEISAEYLAWTGTSTLLVIRRAPVI